MEGRKYMLLLLGTILITFGVIFVFATAVENKRGGEKGRSIIAFFSIILIMVGTNLITKLTMVG